MMSSKKQPIRVRMAPSPTGYFHIGSARTTLFNWLFARHMGGTFILRIEDTDKERSTKEFEQNILESISWLGLDYDEGPMLDGTSKGAFGPYRQSERLDVYEKYLKQLLGEHKAYYCFCTKEELEAQRQSHEAAGEAPKYSGKCRSISDEDVLSRIAEGKSAVIRLKVASERVKFHDLIRGDVEFDNGLTGDIVLAKNLREPLYNFSVVIDDHEMQISHVIRGEDHIANTPKQIALIEALGLTKPIYAHIPLILNADRSKMSKRSGGTTVNEYRAQGYLPDAVINFLTLLGWHPVHNKELLSRAESIAEFDISRVQKGGAVFNLEKLDYFNTQYLKQLSIADLGKLLSVDAYSDTDWRSNGGLFERAVGVVRERMVKLSDFRGLAELFFKTPEYEGALLVWKKGTREGAKQNLERARDIFQSAHDAAFTKALLEPQITQLGEQFGKGDVFWPLRVALSGKESSPPPIEIAEVLGKNESLARIDAAIMKVGESS